jgi:aldehyde:ferredoxin oxidoreductase
MYHGKYAAPGRKAPNYETSGLPRSDEKRRPRLTIAADKLCDYLGSDTISTGSTIGFAYELYEKGIITKEDTGGLELVYGNSDAVPELIRMIAYKEGFGALLAEGSREAGRRIGKGAEDYGIQVKGLELPAYDPRGVKSHGLNLLTANIGADHNTGYAPQEVFGVPIPRAVDRLSPKEKGSLTKWNQDSTAFLETGILCSFMPSMGMLAEDVYGRMLLGATGIKDFEDPAYLWKIGEKITNLERMFNVREGFGRKDDAFPKRIKEEPLPAGPSAGTVFEEDEMLDDYYTARGWDVKTGVPTKAKLEELGLGYTLK